MSATVSDFILERLNEWGVYRIYGFPGDGINALTAAVRRAEEDGQNRIYSGPARGNGCFHGLCPCQVHR